MSDIRLMIQSDDFGMCHAVNEGVAQAFTDGVLTQVSMMPACPWFDEAAAISRDLGIPTGVHLTLTCEWDNLRWQPITSAPSVVGADRTFHRTIKEARQHVTVEDAIEESTAQIERVIAAGIDPCHFDTHMGSVRRDAYRALCAKYDRPFMHPIIELAYPLDSLSGLSQMDADRKLPWMLEYLASLTPGTHLLICHVGVAGAELASITRPTSDVFPWAEEYRKSDLATLIAPEVREAVEQHGIQLVSSADLYEDWRAAVRAGS